MIEKSNICDLVVIGALSIALMAGIFYGQMELSMSISSGLLGYIGVAGRSMKKEERKDEGVY